MTKHLAAVAFVLGIATLAQAQAGFGGPMRDRERIMWFKNIEAVSGGMDSLSPAEKRRLKAQGLEPADKKYIFVYIRPLTEDTDPREFSSCQDAVLASRGAWAFVKMDFDKENAYQKSWGVKSAPACVGCDIYANDFVKVAVPTIDSIRTVIRTTEDLVPKYEARLKIEFQKATDALKSDEEKGSKMFVELCLAGKNGYKEVTEALAKLNELTEPAFRKGELATAVSPETGVDYYDDLVKIYRSTAPGVRAEVLLAILDHARGNVQPAIVRLLKVMKSDARLLKPEVEAASKALEEISKAGDAKIEAALSGTDKAAAKEIIRRLAKEYAGTDAGKRAAEAVK